MHLACPLDQGTCSMTGYKNEKSLQGHLDRVHNIPYKKSGNLVKNALEKPMETISENTNKIKCPLHKEGKCNPLGYSNNVKAIIEHLFSVHNLQRKEATKLAKDTIGEEPPSNEELICHICEAQLPNSKTYKTHIKICNGVKQFRCDECGLSYNWETDLAVHQKRKSHSQLSLNHHQNKEQHSLLDEKKSEYPSFSNFSESTEIHDTISEPTLFFDEKYIDEKYIIDTTSNNENNTIEYTKEDNLGSFDYMIFFNPQAFVN